MHYINANSYAPFFTGTAFKTPTIFHVDQLGKGELSASGFDIS